jgi:hypothetical protein
MRYQRWSATPKSSKYVLEVHIVPEEEKKE